MMTPARYQAELAVLRQKLPGNLFLFCDMNTDHPHVRFGARTNRHNIYTIDVQLANFPEEVPPVFVTQMLHDAQGNPLDECNGSMHTLTSENGWTRICHYGFMSWTPAVSLFKIYVKARLWLEMYEQHLHSGKPIDYYLNHQA